MPTMNLSRAPRAVESIKQDFLCDWPNLNVLKNPHLRCFALVHALISNAILDLANKPLSLVKHCLIPFNPNGLEIDVSKEIPYLEPILNF